MSSGISLENCNYIHIDGGTTDNYGIKIVNTSSVALVIKGKSNHIEINGIDATAVNGGIWAKTDVGDVQNIYNCDLSYLYPNHMDDIKIHDNYIHKILLDGIYAGETDPYGTSRSITCNGVTTTPRPQGLSNFLVYNNRVEQCNRQGIQLSGCDLGINKIYNNTVTDCGFEYSDSQGVGIFVGGATANCEVYGNIINNTWQHGISSYGIGAINIHDNTINNSGILGGKTNAWAMSNIFHNFIDKAGCVLEIENNICGLNSDATNAINVALFNTAGTGNSPDNVVVNSGKIYAEAGVVYTVGTIVPPPLSPIVHFTLDVPNKAVTFHRADNSTITYTNVDRGVGAIKNNVWKVFFTDATNKIVH
jgi:hypothetical protein